MVGEVVGSFSFVDQDSKDDAEIIIRAGEGWIGIAMSLRRDGDMEVLMPPEHEATLQSLLSQAASIATKGKKDR